MLEHIEAKMIHRLSQNRDLWFILPPPFSLCEFFSDPHSPLKFFIFYSSSTYVDAIINQILNATNEEVQLLSKYYFYTDPIQIHSLNGIILP